MGSTGGEHETFLECAHGSIRIFGSTALVRVGSTLEVWRGPFVWRVGALVEVVGPRGPEVVESAGEVVSSLRLLARPG